MDETHGHHHQARVVGIISPGEMGAALGKLLASAGLRVVTTLEERGPRTARLCLEAGLEVADSFPEVVRLADALISVVPPACALRVAELYCEFAALGPEHQIFVDANSVSPATLNQINTLVVERHKSFVDAAIQGLASRLSAAGILLLSGSRAPEVAELFAGALKIRVLGEAPGRASAYKLVMSGIPKGLVALFLELSLAANELGLLDDFLTGLNDLYPGLMEVIDRLLPTYPQHAERRGDELFELERTIQSLGLQPRLISESRRLTATLGRLELSARHPEKQQDGWTTRDLIEAASLHRLTKDP
jgi:3-hydroxyisobutyrate dehydrogenase-like beta-hydroxyacid dehydrogenase